MPRRRFASALVLALALSATVACGGKRTPSPTRPAAHGHTQKGLASWYGPGFHGKQTASGERYDMHGLTAAHKTLPLGTIVDVTRLDNGRTVRVRINDRGPFVRGRIIDLSRGAAEAIDMVAEGVARVRIRVTGSGPARPGAQWLVQVGSFRDRDRALDLRLALEGRVREVSITATGDGWHRVRVGPFASEAKAADVRRRLLRDGAVDRAVVVTAP